MAPGRQMSVKTDSPAPNQRSPTGTFNSPSGKTSTMRSNATILRSPTMRSPTARSPTGKFDEEDNTDEEVYGLSGGNFYRYEE